MSDGMVPQAEVDRIIRERLAEQKAKHETVVGELRTQLGERDTLIGTLKPLAQVAETAQRELLAFKEESVRGEAFRAAGLVGDDKEALRDRITRLHGALDPKDDKGEAIPLHLWLREHAAADPLVGPLLSQAAPPAPGGAPDTRAQGQGAGGAPPPRPPVGAPGRPPDGSRALTADQVRATHRQMVSEGKVKEAREFLQQNATRA
jgi:hypothetical protein